MSNEELRIKCIELVTPNVASQMNVDQVVENAQKVYAFVSLGTTTPSDSKASS